MHPLTNEQLSETMSPPSDRPATCEVQAEMDREDGERFEADFDGTRR